MVYLFFFIEAKHFVTKIRSRINIKINIKHRIDKLRYRHRNVVNSLFGCVSSLPLSVSLWRTLGHIRQ